LKQFQPRKDDGNIPPAPDAATTTPHVQPVASHTSQNPKKRERHNKNVYDGEREAEDAYDTTWRAPEGQSGDGRTSLNAKFGY